LNPTRLQPEGNTIDGAVANRLTRVPEGPVPDLPAAARLALPAADLFMVLMVSRPATGSLRSTWVTPATLQLTIAVALVGLPLGVWLAVSQAVGGKLISGLLGTVVIVLAAGALSVAIVGIAQRLRRR
jgi:hypothetical protein